MPVFNNRNIKEKNQEYIGKLNCDIFSQATAFGQDYLYRYTPDIIVDSIDDIDNIYQSLFLYIDLLPEEERTHVWKEIEKVIVFWANYGQRGSKTMNRPKAIILALKLYASGYHEEVIQALTGFRRDIIFKLNKRIYQIIFFLVNRGYISLNHPTIKFDQDYHSALTPFNCKIFNVYTVFTRLPQIIGSNTELSNLVSENPHFGYFIDYISKGNDMSSLMPKTLDKASAAGNRSALIDVLVHGSDKSFHYTSLRDLVLSKFLENRGYYDDSMDNTEMGFAINSILISILGGKLISYEYDRDVYLTIIRFLKLLPYIHYVLINNINGVEDENLKAQLLQKYFIGIDAEILNKNPLDTYFARQPSFIKQPSSPTSEIGIDYLRNLKNNISPALILLAEYSVERISLDDLTESLYKLIADTEFIDLKVKEQTIKGTLQTGINFLYNLLLIDSSEEEINFNEQLMYKRETKLMHAIDLLSKEVKKLSIFLYDENWSEEEQ